MEACLVVLPLSATLDSLPPPASDGGSDAGSELADLLVAYHHPIRRWLCELLALEGPANVGQLAARTDLAVGSVSHHLKVLHRQGLVEPAPELARDTRESWWRLSDTRISWSVDDFEEGSLGRRVAETAELENLRHQVRAVRSWLQHQPRAPREWRLAAESVDTLTYATVEQLDELGDLLTRTITSWHSACVADQAAHPDAVRRPVRAVARAFPSEPVRP